MSSNASITRVGPRTFGQDASAANSQNLGATNAVPARRFRYLDLRFDAHDGVLWKFLAEGAAAHYSHETLNDLRGVQNALMEGIPLEVEGFLPGAIRFLVFGSRIPGVFSLGGDLALFRELIKRGDRYGLAAYAKKAIDAVYYHATGSGQPLTTISLVQGVALGGGFEAALAGHVIIAERGVRFGLPEVVFGLFPGMGAYTLLCRRVNPKVAERIILSGDTYSAEELHELGIVDELAAPGEGEQVVLDFISRQRMNPGQHAFRKALNRVRTIDHAELYGIADEWIEAALNLSPSFLRRIDRLLRSQDRYHRT